MITLAVDNNPAELKALCEAIKAVHPQAEIIHFIDPMLAFKYSLSHEVDALYTAVTMKRMNGFKLEKMIREDHPNLTANFIAEDETYKAKAIQHLANSYTVKPVTADKLKTAEKEEW